MLGFHSKKSTISQKIRFFTPIKSDLVKFIQNPVHKKIISLALVLSLVTQFSPLINPSVFLARTDIFSRNQGQDLVLILSEESVMKDSTAYDGLRNAGFGGLSARNLTSRVERYATTIQSKLDNTKVEIVTVSEDEDPAKLAALLKQAYFQNLDEYDNRKLVGTVLVGNVPLPVINKAGNQFASMYPYTDFENPKYVYNPDSKYFQTSTLSTSQDFEPEIWHGVIDFTTQDSETATAEQAKSELAVYFDKNYLYHQGVAGFDDFQEKIFYSEPIHEKQSLNEAALVAYDKSQVFYPELLYNRYSTKLFNTLTATEDLNVEELYQGQSDENNLISSPTGLPDADIAMQGPIDSQIKSVLDVYQSSLSKQLDALAGTGRFRPENIFTPITAIAQKDDYQANYFKLVNQLVESRIDQVLEAASTKFAIPRGATLSGEVTYDNGTTANISALNFVNNSPNPDWTTEFVDNLPSSFSGFIGDITPGFRPVTKNDVLRNREPLSKALVSNNRFASGLLGSGNAGAFNLFGSSSNSFVNFIYSIEEMAVYGTPVENITSADQCRIYRGGGTNNPLDKTVKTVRGPFANYSENDDTPVCYEPSEGDEPNMVTYDYVGTGKTYTSRVACSAFFGKNLKEPFRSQPAEQVDFGALTHESCFNMRPESQFKEILNLKYDENNNDPSILAEIDQETTSSDIRLNVADRSPIVLEDVLENLPIFEERETRDWNAWSYYLLGNPAKTNFVIENPENLPGVAKIELNVRQYKGSFAFDVADFTSGVLDSLPTEDDDEPAEEPVYDDEFFDSLIDPNSSLVSSFVKHSDPSEDIIQAISEGSVSQDLPINATRYATFINKSGETQRLVYPNLFTSSSLEDYLTELRVIEKYLSILADRDLNNSLTSVIKNTDEFSADYSSITSVDRSKLNYLLTWRFLSLNQKYSQVYKNFLNTSNPLKFESFPSSFQMAVITAESSQDGLDLSVVSPDYQPMSLLQSLDQDFTLPANPFEELLNNEQKARDAKPRSTVQPVTNECYSGPDGIPLGEWFTNYLPCWLDSVREIGTELVNPIRTGSKTYKEAISNPEAEVASIEITPVLENYSFPQYEKVEYKLTILDSDQKKIVGKPVFVDLKVSGAIQADATQDADSTKPGTQLFLASGETILKFNITNSGPARIQASIPSQEDSIVEDLNFTIHSNLKLSSAFVSNTSTTAGSEVPIDFVVKLQNQTNQNLNFKAPILTLQNPKHGKIELKTDSEVANQFEFSFTPNKVSAQAVINIAYPGLDPIQQTINILPAAPKKLYFKELVTKADASQESLFEIELQYVDEFNNRVLRDLSNISITSTSTDKVEILNSPVNIVNGKATVQLKAAAGAFGNSFIQATKAGLSNGIHKVQLSETLGVDQFAMFQSPALYYELRTNTDGRQHAKNILKTGKSQAVATLTTSTQGFAPAFYINANGSYYPATSSNRLNSSITLSEQGYKYAVLDQDQQDVAWVNLTTSSLDSVSTISSTEQISSPGVYLLSMQEEDEEQKLFSLNQLNQIIPASENVTFEIIPSEKFITVSVKDSSVEIAQVVYALTAADFSVQRNIGNLNYDVAEKPIGGSTNSPKGLVFYDLKTELSPSQIPSSSLKRTDKALTNANQGLTEDGKSLLLFSAGMSAGESNRPYLSEAGIVLGDPTISLPLTSATQSSFNQDIGKFLARTDANISHILPLEDQVLIADKNGNISRLSLENKRFYKNLLNIPNGIKELIASQKSSNQIELFVLTEKACANEDTCLYQITFDDDLTQTTQIEVDLPTKAVRILSMDFDNDEDDDLLVLGENSLLYLFERQENQIKKQPNIIGNIYNELDSDDSILDDFLITLQSNLTSPSSNPIKINFETEPSLQTAPGQFSQSVLVTNQAVDFQPVTQIPQLAGTTLTVRDANQELLRNNDTLNYTLNLNSTTAITNAKISFRLNANEQLAENSLSPSSLSFEQTLNRDRPLVISNINIPANGSLQIKFNTTYTRQTESQIPLIYLVQNEADSTPDVYPDIKVVLTGQNKIIYYHSELDTTSNIFRYARNTEVIPDTGLDLVDDQFKNLPVSEDISEAGLNTQIELSKKMKSDSLGQQIDARIARTTTKLNKLDEKISEKISDLMCSGKGCLVMPVNIAFLVPPSPTVLPIFGWGCPSAVPIWPATPFQTCAGGRQYISPTLTGEFVGATCVGPFMGAACWTYKIGDLGAACDAINNFAVNIINEATEIVNEGVGAASGGIISIGPNSGQERPENINVPGFPAIFTDWVTNQAQEITKLLDLPDLTVVYPTVDSLLGYFRPVDEELEAAQNDFEDIGYLGMEDALSKLSALPLFNVKIEEHEIKYPWFPSGDEFNKYQTQAYEILEANLTELHNTLESWGCYGNSFRTFADFKLALKNGGLKVAITNAVFDNPNVDPLQAEACIQLSAGFEGFYLGFTANLDALKRYRDLPKNIFAVENFVADYAEQALSYAEIILDRSAGFLVNNTQALIEWQEFLKSIQNIINEFSAILDFLISFMSSCDDCRTDRTNMDLTMLFNFLLGAIPELPVFVLPKLPDITLDFSKVEAGVDIVLPGFTFVPERISLPDLNTFLIDLPDAIPIGFDFNLAKFGISPVVKLPEPPDIEQYILALPPLPELEIPEFPVLPRPPEIGLFIEDFIAEIKPTLDILSAVLRIVCTILKGLVPVPEAFLKTRIESMTNRPLTPVLPIDLALSFTFPALEYEYISEYKIILESYFNIDFSTLDELSLIIVDRINAATDQVQSGVDQALQRLMDQALPPIELDLNSLTEDLDLQFEAELDPQGAVDEAFETITEDLSYKLNEYSKKIPTELNLVATTEKIDLETALAYEPQYLGNIPPQLEENYQKLVAFKQAINSRTSKNIASLDSDLSFAENTSTVKYVAREIPTLTSFPESGEFAPTFSPEKGIYYENPNSTPPNKVEKLVAYAFESNNPLNTAFVDYNGNSANDIIYSKGKELYLKINQSEEYSPVRVTGSVSTRTLDSIESISLQTIEESEVNTITQNREVVFTLPESLSNATTLVDIYNSSFDDNTQVARYILNSSSSVPKYTEFTKVRTFSQNGFSLPRDGFNQLYQKDNFTRSIAIPLENNNYRASVSIVNPQTGKIEILKQSIAITPNICKDRVPPVFDSNIETNITVSVFQPLTLDFTDVYDTGSSVTQIYLDTDLQVDSDSDGDATNDFNLPNRSSGLVRRFLIPAFTTTGTKRINATASDEAGNLSTQEIFIQVVPPEITIDNSANNIQGSTTPEIADLPISIIRDRDGVVEELFETTTNANGQFSSDSFTNSENIAIRDADNSIIFEINNTTSSLKKVSSQANIGFAQPLNPGDPTTILLKKGDQTITTLAKVSDINQDVQIVTSFPAKKDLAVASNVYVKDEIPTDQISVTQILGSDPTYPGGANLNLNGTPAVKIDTTGGVKILDDSFQIRLQTLTDLSEYQSFELIHNNKLVASVIPTFAKTEISFTEPTQVERVARPPVRPQTVASTTTPVQDFVDVSGPNQAIIKYLQSNGVIEGVLRDNQRFFEPTRQITRAEYAKIILNILCIAPSEPSFLRPSVFSDIPFSNNLPWYYSFTKETQIQKIFTGYLGEINSITNLPPFKPQNSITLAEATKVVIEALVNNKVITLDNLQTTEPWYDAYLEIAQDITPYINDNIITNQDFILTPEEAQTPAKQITREEFAVIAFRVLSLNNCIEKNKSQLTPSVPTKPTSTSETTSPNSTTNENSQPGTSNSTNTTSTQPSTSTTQNQSSSQNSQTNAGIYMQQLSCVSCPCQYRYDYLATVRNNDTIFAVIRDPETGEILQKSLTINK